MMANPQIAVIIPCFNDGRFLPDALESLYSQTFKDWEAIIVDDASDDLYTKGILQTIDNVRITVVRHPNNRGLGAARNTGIRLTTAPLIFPLDADDKFIPKSLSIVKIAFDTEPEVDLFYPDLVIFGEINENRQMPEMDFPSMIQKPFAVATSPFRREAWAKAGGYDEGSVMRLGMEDVDFHLSLLEAGCVFRRLPEAIYCYRMRPYSLSRRMQVNNYEIRRYIAQKHSTILNGQLRQEFLQMGAIRSYRAALYIRDYRSALAYGFKILALCLWPPNFWWRAAWNVFSPMLAN